MRIDAAKFGKEIGKLVNDAIDRRLGTQRPGRLAHMAVKMRRVEKFVGNGKRTIRGLASTPNVDRHGDIVVPGGGDWNLPLPLLWQHRHDEPIGWVKEARVTPQGLHIVAELAEGLGRADDAWAMIEAKLVDSFSIGFIGLKGSPIPTGTKWEKWELIETSIVTVPSNRESKIGKSAHGGIKLIDTRGSVKLISGSSR